MKYNPDLHNRHSIRLRGHDYARAGAYFVTICCQNRINYFGEIVNNEMAFNEYGYVACKEWKKLSERYSGIAFDIFQIMPNHIHGIIKIHNTNANVGATLAVAQNPNSDIQNANMAAQNPNSDIQNANMVAQNPNSDTPNSNANTMNANIVTHNSNTVVRGVAAMGAAIFESRATARVAPTVTVGFIVGAYKSLVLKKCLEISNLKNCILGKLWQRNYHEHIIRNEIECARIAEYIQNNPILWKKGHLNTIL